MLGLKEAALAAGVAESTIYRAAKKGRISANAGDGGRLLFEPSEIERWATTRAGAPVAPDERRNDDSLAVAPLQARIEAMAQQIAELQDDKRDLRAERDRLLGVVETQTRLLAAPAAGSGWRFWRRRSAA